VTSDARKFYAENARWPLCTQQMVLPGSMHFGFHTQLTLCHTMPDTSVLYNSAAIQTAWAKQTLRTMHKHSKTQQTRSLQQIQVF